MLITLLRHGRTVANAGGLLQGRVDNPLDDTGRAQAEAVAPLVGAVDLVVASPLRRALETATLVAPEVEARVDERWIELDYGEWDERPVRDVPADTWQRWRTDLDLRPPGGETLRELGVRVRAALDDIAGAPVDHVLVVSHVSPIKAAVAWALGVGDEVSWRTNLTTASLSRIRVDGDRRVLTEFNLTAPVA